MTNRIFTCFFPSAALLLDKTYFCPHSANIVILFRYDPNSDVMLKTHFTYPSHLTLPQTDPAHLQRHSLHWTHCRHQKHKTFWMARGHFERIIPVFLLVFGQHTYNQLPFYESEKVSHRYLDRTCFKILKASSLQLLLSDSHSCQHIEWDSRISSLPLSTL